MRFQSIGLKALYQNLRIKHKLFLLFSFVMTAVCACFLTVLQYVYDVYDKEIHSQASQSLSVTSFGLENELIKLENLTFRMATDTILQSYLTSVKQGNSDYEQFVTTRDIRERLMSIGGSEKYVLSMQMIDVFDNEYATGVRPITTPAAKISDVKEIAVEGQGGNRWVLPDSADSNLIAAREIRSYISHVNIDLEQLGFIMVRVNLDALMADYSRGLDNKGSQLIIMSGEEMIYPQTFPGDYIDIRDQLPTGQGYSTVELERNKYFVTHLPSNYTNWTYIIISPYDTIFYAINNVKTFVFLFLSGIIALTLLLSIWFARSITRPIESLNYKMKRVQMGDFATYDLEPNAPLLSDESGQMHRNFRIMLERINELINENFKKQLAIKESEFKALQAQINPHFLYNTLESINWLAKMAKQQRISIMVESLGYLLRSSISNKHPLTSIQEELAIVEHYIKIQQLRYEERLAFSGDIPAALSQCQLPRMTLQPLVENAIKYALEHMIETCHIELSATLDGDTVIIAITDNGPGFEPEFLERWNRGVVQSKQSGIGLLNINERIKLLFGQHYGLRLERADAMTQVLISIPFRRETEPHESV